MSKKALKVATYSIHNFIKHNIRGKSFSTVASIRERLTNSMKDLHSLGYPIRNINNIQKKHIDALVKSWQEKKLSAGSIKNRMSDFRLYSKVSGRTHLVESSNKEYGIPNRSYIPTKNKAIFNIDLNKIGDKYLKASVELQKEFGLRREECLKIVPSKALKYDEHGRYYLALNSSWTKGGVGRTILIRNETQLNAIKNAISVANSKSLIPTDKSYIQQRRSYDNVTREQGYYNLHGLRHAYAQTRYKELTGWKCPINGGPTKRELNLYQRELDHHARLRISQELGHSRASITKNYIG
jgi:hypothetical protein